MNADEIVKGLQVEITCENCPHNNLHESECFTKGCYFVNAADLIESLQAQLAKEKRRERAAVEDMKVMALAMRESEEISEGCCFACKYDAQNLPGDVILGYGECPGYECNDCFEWRGDAEEGDAE